MNDFRHDPPPDPPPQIVDVEHRAVSEAPLPPAALKRPWWRKKRHMAWYLPTTLALLALFALGGDPEPAPVEPATAVEEPAPEPEVEPVDEVPEVDPDPLGDVVIPEPDPEPEVEPVDAEDVELPESMRREIAQLALQSTWDGMDSEEQASICVAMYLDEGAVLDAFMEGASDSDLKRKDARTFFHGAC